MKTFKGRVIIGGAATGRSVVRKGGLNALDTFLGEQNTISGRMLCLPAVVGSTTGGMIVQATIKAGSAPTAMLFSKRIDALAAAGVMLAKHWNNKQMITIDELGDEFLNYVRDGMTIRVQADGTVEVS